MALSIMRLVTREDADKVTHLRKVSFQNSYGSNVNLDKLAWNENDERFQVLGIFEESTRNLISSIRLGLLQTAYDFKMVMNFPFISDIFPLPLATINRVVTHPDYGSRGYHGALRMAAIKISQLGETRGIVGVMEEGSLRLKQMAEIGYELHKMDQPWTGFIKNQKPIIAGLLRPEKYESAIAVLENRKTSRELNSAFKIVDQIDYKLAANRMQHTISFSEPGS